MVVRQLAVRQTGLQISHQHPHGAIIQRRKSEGPLQMLKDE